MAIYSLMSQKTLLALIVPLSLVLGGCNSGSSDGSPQNPLPTGSTGEGVEEVSDLDAWFTSQVQPRLDFCRTCHAPGKSADTPEGRGFMLSDDPAADYANFQSSWDTLGGGVDTSPILTQNANSAEGHTGGVAWPLGSAGYTAVATVLTCWENPDSCEFGNGGEIEEALPLLGSARGGHFWDDFCNGLVDKEGKRFFSEDGELLTQAQATPLADDIALPGDPRALVLAGANADRAVFYNAFYKDCHVFPEMVGEFHHPKTCGDLRASVARGAIIMGDPEAQAFDENGEPYRYGTHEPYERSDGKPSIYKGHYSEGEVIRPGSTFAGDNPHGYAALTAATFNQLWAVWGMPGRPDNFDELLAERYGFGQPDDNNPYPIVDPLNGIDETTTLSVTNGGSGRLPVGLIQTRMPDGSYSGEISQNCQGCHGSEVGDQFVVGGGGGMLDATVSARDYAALGSAVGVVIDRAGFGGRVRGTNNAQFSNILAFTGARTQAEVNDALQNGSTGTGDTPAWWNVGRRPLKFVDGMFPNDAVRVDFALFSPLLTDKYMPFDRQESERDDRWTSDHVQDGDHYIITRKAPEYPLSVDTALAKEGAVLFHTKNLWAKPELQSVPAPEGGNGSCASCHGAYSPRYVNDPAFLSTPKLEGIASYVVPMDIIGTDSERFETYNQGTNSALSNTDVGYPETGPNHSAQASLSEEEKAQVQDCRVQNLPGLQKDAEGKERPGGYAAPPLYGVWATAPYLHNGSVPTVAALLDSSQRPAIWRRVSKPARAGQEDLVVMGYDNDLNRAYDQTAMGWQYDELECGGGDFLPQLDCTPVEQSNLDFFLSEFYSGLLLGWNITNPPTLTNDDIEARKIYNTHMWGQGNGGHTFSDVLTSRERQAIIEYLKTL